jgi:hypothetical protein
MRKNKGMSQRMIGMQPCQGDYCEGNRTAAGWPAVCQRVRIEREREIEIKIDQSAGESGLSRY